jgi:predicted cupin superfamily sugar epimerase
MDTEAKKLIHKYQLQPHPEGGYYREIFCSSLQVESGMVAAQRPAMTHIYFLLGRGEHSRFHRVAHDELWHFYAGSPLQLYMFAGEGVEVVTLGQDTEPVAVVPGGVYQAAESSGAYTLVGCSVAPGFDFADFSFLADHPEHRDHLVRCNPEFHNWL